MAKKRYIRNSTAEFLIFRAQSQMTGEPNPNDGVEVLYHDETIWATQKAMAELFGCSTDNIGLHLKNIYESGELQRDSTTEKYSVVQIEGKREVNRQTLFYNLDAIITTNYELRSTNYEHPRWERYMNNELRPAPGVTDWFLTTKDSN